MYLWNVAKNVLSFFEVCHKHNFLPFGPIQPSSPSTKELHGSTDKARHQVGMLIPFHNTRRSKFTLSKLLQSK